MSLLAITDDLHQNLNSIKKLVLLDITQSYNRSQMIKINPSRLVSDIMVT